MGEEGSPPVLPPPTTSSPTDWRAYISEELPRSVQESADTAIKSARSLQHTSSTYFRSFQDSIPHIGTSYRSYEDAFFNKIKEELMGVREHPVMAGGIAVTAALLLMRGMAGGFIRYDMVKLSGLVNQ